MDRAGARGSRGAVVQRMGKPHASLDSWGFTDSKNLGLGYLHDLRHESLIFIGQFAAGPDGLPQKFTFNHEQQCAAWHVRSSLRVDSL